MQLEIRNYNRRGKMPRFLDALYQRLLLRLIGKRAVAANLEVKGGIRVGPTQHRSIIYGNVINPPDLED
jgi:hypothetical protein